MTASITLQEYERIQPSTSVQSGGQTLQFWTPNTLTQLRAASLFGPNRPTSERETVRWINEMSPGDVLVDIGANVGMYTVLAASKGVRVIAIEPESSNYAALNRNLRLNGLDDAVFTVNAGMSNETKFTKMHIRNDGVGQSCHAVGSAVLPNGEVFDESQSHAQTIMSYRLEDLLEAVNENAPTHIKIDVDGIEHLVVEGMASVLDLASLKTVLIELDPGHPGHQQIFQTMADSGFEISSSQLEECTIKQGGWAGYCNVIFYKKSCGIVPSLWPINDPLDGVELQPAFAVDVSKKVEMAEIIESPTPHLIVENVFSDETFQNIRKIIPDARHYVPMDDLGWTRGATGRKVFAHRDDFLTMLPPKQDRLLRELLAGLMDGNLLALAAQRFASWIPELTNGSTLEGFSAEACITKDYGGYEIGPHTDAPDRVLTLMYYLPENESCINSGTGLFVPKQDGFQCPGTKWHDFEGFDEVKRVPFKPNTLFGFVKTGSSFHGVMPLESAPIDRDIIHITLHKKDR